MPLQQVLSSKVRIDSEFWTPIQDRAESISLPAIFDAQKSWGHWPCLTWGEGHEPKPHQFWDSDIYKAVEAACYFLVRKPNKDLSALVEEAVDMIRGAQYADGYINSYYTVRGIDKRWTNLRDDHELYCMGHLLEATVAYEMMCGSGRLLEVAMKICQHLDSVFGPGEDKLNGYPGHQEVEIGLLRLYELTQDPLPLDLAKYFISERGKRDENDETYFDKEAKARGGDPYDFMGSEFKHYFQEPRDYGYQQADGPLMDATDVKGHSVRAMYYYTAATDLARLLAQSDDQNTSLLKPLNRLWRDLVDSKLYVTGAIGSVGQWEGFGPRHLLPDLEDEGCYGETCASFALINWCARLLQTDLRSEYADVQETALYNGFLGAISSDGDAFYYQNVLRTQGGKPKERNKWFGVACCPPNAAKLLGNLGTLIYNFDTQKNLVVINQYIGSQLNLEQTDNTINITSSFPWQGDVTIKVRRSCELALRIPGWADGWTCSSEGKLVDGYLYVAVSENSEVSLAFPIKPQRIYPNPATGKDDICIRRGPLIYCFEDVDNDGVDIDYIKLLDVPVTDHGMMTLPNFKGIQSVVAKGQQLVKTDSAYLYSSQPWRFEEKSRELVAIPYFLRANRGGNGAMRVWIPRTGNMMA